LTGAKSRRFTDSLRRPSKRGLIIAIIIPATAFGQFAAESRLARKYIGVFIATVASFGGIRNTIVTQGSAKAFLGVGLAKPILIIIHPVGRTTFGVFFIGEAIAVVIEAITNLWSRSVTAIFWAILTVFIELRAGAADAITAETTIGRTDI